MNMERVETLCDQLKNQLAQGASIQELLQTVQMVQSELMHLQAQSEVSQNIESVALHIPSSFEHIYNPPSEEKNNEDKVVLNLDINEKEIEDELEQIKRNAELKNLSSFKNRPTVFFDPADEIPTLSQHKRTQLTSEEPKVQPDPVVPQTPQVIHPINITEETASLNEKLGKVQKEISDTLSEGPIKDLRKGIPINDRFLFINELFKGDEVMFDRSIKTINSFSIYPEAEYWMMRELKLKLGWDEKSSVVKQFDQLVKRRFSAM